MRAFIYCADIYCGACGKSIRARLKREGKAPENPRDETTYDSDDYPKGPYEDGGGEADTPQHCGSAERCLNAIELTRADGLSFKVGAMLENDLTSDGIEYVNEYIRSDPGSPVVQLWREFYKGSYSEIA